MTRNGRRMGVWGVRSAMLWSAVCLAVALLAGDLVVYRKLSADAEPTISGVERFDVPDRHHTSEHVDYPRTPPAGGPHAPVWLNCGVYDRPVRAENAVHSLEHGAVWITYDPALPSDQVTSLRRLARGRHHLILSPYPDLPSPVVASAWGRQLRLSTPSDDRLAAFVDAYRSGPQAPEKAGPCERGVGTPITAG